MSCFGAKPSRPDDGEKFEFPTRADLEALIAEANKYLAKWAAFERWLAAHPAVEESK